MMPTVSEELTERAHTLTAALYKGSLSAVSASLPPLAEALAPAAAEHWGLVKTMGRNIGHTMEELTDMGFALDALDKLVSSKSKEIRAAACWALAEIGAERPENVSGLAYRLAKDDAWEVRDQIAAAYDERIGPAQPRSLFEMMRRWSNDSDERVRRAPALALIRRARRDRVPVLAILEVLRRDSSIYVRKGVVYCLQQAWGRAENPNYGPPTPDSPAFLLRTLREWAKDPSPNTRWVVAYTLAHTWVAPYLADALATLRIVARDPNEMVQKAVTAALLGLRKLGNPLLRRTLEAWARENFEPTVSQLARRVLTEIPAAEESAELPPPAPVAPPPARHQGRAHDNRAGRAGNDGRTPSDNRAGGSHRQRRHQPSRTPTDRPPASNGNAPPPALPRAETPAPLSIEPAAPAAPATHRQRNRPHRAEAASSAAITAPPVEAPAPIAAPPPPPTIEAPPPSPEPAAPKKRAAKPKSAAITPAEPPAPEASAAPKKRTAKPKAVAAPAEDAANAAAATDTPKKPRRNSNLKSQISNPASQEQDNG